MAADRPSIVRRKVEIDFEPVPPGPWFPAAGPLETMFGAASLSFPPNERFFIDAVRCYADRITDPELEEAVQGFIHQEAMHNKVHADFNEMLARHNPHVPVAQQVSVAAFRLAGRLPRVLRISLSSALEHFTAMAADTLLRYRREFEQIVPEQVSQMWFWHAAEETEHKAVCFDVMQHVNGRWAYLNRVAGMLLATPFFLLFVLLLPSIVLGRHRPCTTDTGPPKFILPEGSDAMRFAGRSMVGLLRELIPWRLYFSYYKPSFHPWDHDNSHAIAEWQARHPDFGMSAAPAPASAMTKSIRTRVLLVYPGFNEESFWSLAAACRLCNVHRPEPPLGLLTVAAMLPSDWEVRLVDRNVRPMTGDELAWADMVMTGGMIAQRRDTLTVIDECRAAGKPVVVGGPDPTSCEEVYESADFLVLGEAEGILAAFIDAWRSGQRHGRFRAEKFKADITTTPIPRFDLLGINQYLWVGVQFSRGCPFTCEFCDIIELYGRVPRSKTTAQMLAELQALYDTGHRGIVNFVDDNLIGHKKALRLFLPELARWQAERSYPFMFMTEASINLADDAELLKAMGRANFFAVFVGVETPDAGTLVAIRKKQNTQRSLVDSIHRIQAAGMFVFAGFVIGFDSESGSVAEAMIECIEQTGIPGCALSLLCALPNTQLHRRLEQEGRLLPAGPADDLFASTLNFRPSRPLRDILLDYRKVLSAIYTPQAYFERVRRTGRRLQRPALHPVQRPDSQVSRPKLVDRALARLGLNRFGLGGLIWRNLAILLKLMAMVTFSRRELRRPFWRTLIDIARHNPAALEVSILQMGLFLHFGRYAARMVGELDKRIAALPSAPPGQARAADAVRPPNRQLERPATVRVA